MAFIYHDFVPGFGDLCVHKTHTGTEGFDRCNRRKVDHCIQAFIYQVIAEQTAIEVKQSRVIDAAAREVEASAKRDAFLKAIRKR